MSKKTLLKLRTKLNLNLSSKSKKSNPKFNLRSRFYNRKPRNSLNKQKLLKSTIKTKKSRVKKKKFQPSKSNTKPSNKQSKRRMFHNSGPSLSKASTLPIKRRRKTIPKQLERKMLTKW